MRVKDTQEWTWGRQDTPMDMIRCDTRVDIIYLLPRILTILPLSRSSW